MGNIFSPYLYLCFSHRTSTSSATRLLSSTWVALTTMQRKRTDNHPSIFLLWGPQTKPTEWANRKTAWDKREHWTFSGSEIQILHQRGQKATKTATRKSLSNSVSAGVSLRSCWVWRLSMCNPYTYLSVPVWRTYNTCVLWSAISNMNQWNTNGFWTGIMILYVYKTNKQTKKRFKKTKQKKHKSLDICCTLNGLFILNFVSIGLMY